MTKLEKQLLTRVDELERRIKELEARPSEYHTHWHTAPQTYYTPLWCQPWAPPTPTWTIGGGASSTGSQFILHDDVTRTPT